MSLKVAKLWKQEVLSNATRATDSATLRISRHSTTPLFNATNLQLHFLHKVSWWPRSASLLAYAGNFEIARMINSDKSDAFFGFNSLHANQNWASKSHHPILVPSQRGEGQFPEAIAHLCCPLGVATFNYRCVKGIDWQKLRN